MARRWFLIDEKVRFVIAGIVNMAIRYLIFVLLGLAFSVSRYQLVLLATWLLSSVIAFFSYKHLVFRTEGNHLKEFVKSLLIWCLSYVLNAALLEVLAGRLAWNVYLAQAAAIVLIVVVNYLLFKHFAFRPMWRKYIYELDGTDALPGYQILYDFRYILFRLGEACLNYAEALGRKGEIDKAIRMMNMTRTQHGGLPALPESSSEADFWKYYKIERRVELALEGDRYFSVIRWAKVENATSVSEFNKRTHCIIIDGDDDTFTLIDTSHGSSTGSDRVFSWPRRMYFPLPESELMSNPNLQQNNHW